VKRDGRLVTVGQLARRSVGSRLVPVTARGRTRTYRAWNVARLRARSTTVKLIAVAPARSGQATRSTLLGVTSETRLGLEQLASALHSIGALRSEARRARREGLARGRRRLVADFVHSRVRPNLALAKHHDQLMHHAATRPQRQRGVLERRAGARADGMLNVVELFAGAGGLALGFLLAERVPPFRLLFSGEIDETAVATLRGSHARLRSIASEYRDRLPTEVLATDLRKPRVLNSVMRAAKRAGGVDVLLGGPPCQGFSNANRNSWHPANPNNRLISVFARWVEALKPAIFVFENVQGIRWTGMTARSRRSVLATLVKRLELAGYDAYMRTLDAAWFGVPQFRNRVFVVGIRRGLGYQKSDFGDWGPFPFPTHGPGLKRSYVTVSDAIRDLPRVRNGQSAPVLHANGEKKGNAYLRWARRHGQSGVILDHVTSRHADYVIARYRAIPPGGNWRHITRALGNYASVERTHSNIYRRLEWNEPAVTIGHYRKSMLVHPSQARGLSLREACRLQSFPDWFRFSGTPDGSEGGLSRKQQQLANAVCPLVAKALAEYLGRL